MCEGWDLSRGFSGKGARHKIGSKGYEVLHGVFRKTVISLLRFRTKNGIGFPPVALVVEITGDWRHQGLDRVEERGEEKKGRLGRGSQRARRSGAVGI
jgi:hypothetical protein